TRKPRVYGITRCGAPFSSLPNLQTTDPTGRSWILHLLRAFGKACPDQEFALLLVNQRPLPVNRCPLSVVRPVRLPQGNSLPSQEAPPTAVCQHLHPAWFRLDLLLFALSLPSPASPKLLLQPFPPTWGGSSVVGWWYEYVRPRRGSTPAVSVLGCQRP